MSDRVPNRASDAGPDYGETVNCPHCGEGLRVIYDVDEDGYVERLVMTHECEGELE